MAKLDLSERMQQDGVMLDWASRTKSNMALTEEDKEIAEVVDAFARTLGESGKDVNHDLSALFQRTFTEEVVSAPSELISAMFDEGSIGEFDDFYVNVEPKNTIQVHDGLVGGNVPASYLEHRALRPTYKSLQAETYIPYSELRRGGYRTVANYLDKINSALEEARIEFLFGIIDAAITDGMENYMSGTTLDATAMDELVLYVRDMEASGVNPVLFMLNKYRQKASKLESGERWTEAVKSIYNSTGFTEAYDGVKMLGYSGQKKLANGSLIVPDKRVFGIAGKVGTAVTRGSTRVYQTEDNNREQVHVKVAGFDFGYVITDISKVAKLVLA